MATFSQRAEKLAGYAFSHFWQFEPPKRGEEGSGKPPDLVTKLPSWQHWKFPCSYKTAFFESSIHLPPFYTSLKQLPVFVTLVVITNLVGWKRFRSALLRTDLWELKTWDSEQCGCLPKVSHILQCAADKYVPIDAFFSMNNSAFFSTLDHHSRSRKCSPPGVAALCIHCAEHKWFRRKMYSILWKATGDFFFFLVLWYYMVLRVIGRVEGLTDWGSRLLQPDLPVHETLMI